MDVNSLVRGLSQSLCRRQGLASLPSCTGVRPSRRALSSTHHLHATTSDDVTPDTPTQSFQAAQPFDFSRSSHTADGQSLRRNDDETPGSGRGAGGGVNKSKASPETLKLFRRLRVVPGSPSYFTAIPTFTDKLLRLESLYRKTQLLPTVKSEDVTRVSWKTLEQYNLDNKSETIKAGRYSRLLKLLQRMQLIQPSLMPLEVHTALQGYMRSIQPSENRAKPLLMDQWGRIRAVGRRKASTAVAFVVQGDGQVMVNGKSLTELFGRVHDRESAIWPLKVTDRVDRYNVWAHVNGGGTTGQAEALMLGVAKALLGHEPELKPALRKAGCLTRDPRRVERKKPGRLKARKMPTWVKR